MGGCCSTITKKQEKPAGAAPGGPLLPEPDAEETVKEVLSETPRVPRPRPLTEKARVDLVPDPKEMDLVDKDLPLPGIVLLPIDGGDARSEDTSEAWSVSAKSEALSASSAAPAEKRRCAAAETGRRAPRERLPGKHQRKRSVSGELASRRDQSVSVGCGSGRSSPLPLARRPEQAGVGRTNSARETARSRAATGIAARRDAGERSGRRSVSPAAKRTAELRQSAGQCRVLPPSLPASAKAKGRNQEYPMEEGGRSLCTKPEGARGGAEVPGSEGEANESLENPLVSLECFIFL